MDDALHQERTASTWTPRHEREAYAAGLQVLADQIRKGLAEPNIRQRLASLTFLSEAGFRRWLQHVAVLPAPRVDLELQRLHQRLGTGE